MLNYRNAIYQIQILTKGHQGEDADAEADDGEDDDGWEEDYYYTQNDEVELYTGSFNVEIYGLQPSGAYTWWANALGIGDKGADKEFVNEYRVAMC